MRLLRKVIYKRSPGPFSRLALRLKDPGVNYQGRAELDRLDFQVLYML